MRNSYITTKDVASIEDSFFSTNQINEIRKKTPVSEIEVKTDENGFKYNSVKASFVKRKLNIIFGFNFDFQIISKEYFQPSREAIVHGRLTVRTANGTIIKEQFGNHYLSTKKGSTSTSAVNIGDGYKSAASDSLKKCASEIGLSWDIYNQPRPEVKPEPVKDHKEDVVYNRLKKFLSECITVDEIKHITNTFEQNTKIEPKHEELISDHMNRVLELNK